MSDVQMDPASMVLHAQHHHDAATAIEEALALVPESVDGGMAAETVAAIIAAVVQRAGTTAIAHHVVGDVITSTVEDSTATDASVADHLDDVTVD